MKRCTEESYLQDSMTSALGGVCVVGRVSRANLQPIAEHGPDVWLYPRAWRRLPARCRAAAASAAQVRRLEESSQTAAEGGIVQAVWDHYRVFLCGSGKVADARRAYGFVASYSNIYRARP